MTGAEEVGVEPDLDEAFAAAAGFLDPVLDGRANGRWDADRSRWT